jgi:phosphate uptake regulator
MTEYSTRVDHTAKAFDSDLQEIMRKVAEMGGLVEKQISDAAQALLERDTELAERVIATDPTIDTMQRDIEEKSIACATTSSGSAIMPSISASAWLRSAATFIRKH